MPLILFVFFMLRGMEYSEQRHFNQYMTLFGFNQYYFLAFLKVSPSRM